MRKNKNFGSVIIGGPAGYGVIRAGWLLGKAFSVGGLYSFVTSEYPSLIQGGHNFVMVRFSPDPIHSHWPTADVLIAFDETSIRRHIGRIEEYGVVIYDSTRLDASKYEHERDNIVFLPIPLTRIVKDENLPLITRNVVALGAFCTIMNYQLGCLYETIRKAFKGREKIIELNIKAANIGKEYVEKNFDYRIILPFKPPYTNPKYFISGNEAISLGAIAGGVTWYSAYPMTPASPILHYLVRKQYENNMIVIQPESEIAAILMAIGASFAGARVMTGTSGGGFSLMTEALGHAAMTETPIVIVLAQRPGPSTGLATHTAQGDLRFALHASQGEFPRIVIAPGDVVEAFYYTQVALNLAEKYQVPAIIITDKHLGESWMAVDDLDKYVIPIERGKIVESNSGASLDNYGRFMITEDGVSPRAFPGTKGAIIKVDGNEHNEYGYTTEDPEVTIAMHDKRWRKMKYIEEEIRRYAPVKLYGVEDAEIGIIAWGSTKGAILDAMKLLESDGIKVKYMQVIFLSPFPTQEVEMFLNSVDVVIDVENNKTGQLAGLIREYTGYRIDRKVLKYNGRPFSELELYERIKEVLE